MGTDLGAGLAGVQEMVMAECASRESGIANASGEWLQGVEALIDELAAMALSAPEVRLHRIEALKTQIAGRTYRVSDADLADALLGQMHR